MKGRPALLLFVIITALFPLTLGAQTLGEEKDRRDELKKILEGALPEARPLQVQAVVDIPRSFFIPEAFLSLAEANLDIPVLSDAILPSPLLVLRLLYESGIRPGASVLIIGKGTGYLAAAAAEISSNVTAVEFSPELYGSYPDTFAELDSNPVNLVNSLAGAAESGFMFDIVIIHGATPVLTPEISSFLRPSGVLIVPITGKSGYQNLIKIQYGNGLTVSTLGESFFPIVEELY